MNTALDIARYIINHSIDIGRPISHLKLQKILFYVQAAHLVTYEKPAFSEKIMNWQYGPVVPVVYATFKNFGYEDIHEKISSYKEMVLDPDTFDISFIDVSFDGSMISEATKDLIQNIVISYSNTSAIGIMKKTHMEEPWKSTKNGDEISQEAILSYYKKNEGYLYNKGAIDV